ncbi:MAG: T9SS type A sorting domain-containing protein [Bacteroidota bacterium]
MKKIILYSLASLLLIIYCPALLHGQSSRQAYNRGATNEKIYNWNGISCPASMVKVADGYMALTSTLSYTNPSHYVFSIIHFNNNGDSVGSINLARNAGYGGKAYSLKLCPDGNLLAALTVHFTARYSDTDSVGMGRIQVIKLTQTGTIIWEKDLHDTYGYTVFDMYMYPDGRSVLAAGAGDSLYRPVLVSGASIFLNAEGNEITRNIYSNCTDLRNIEPLPGGGFLFGGTDAQDMINLVTDNYGNQIRLNNFYYPNLYRNGVNYSVSKAAPDGNVYVFGSPYLPPRDFQWYLGRHTPAGEIVWEIQLPGYGEFMHALPSGNVLVNILTDAASVLFTISPQGQFLQTDTLAKGRNKIILSEALFTGTDSAVFIGNFGEHKISDLYFMKKKIFEITGLQPLISAHTPITPYPNPASQFLSLDAIEQGELLLYSASGFRVLQQHVSPGEKVNVSSLGPGLYMYSFTTAAGLSTGKIALE